MKKKKDTIPITRFHNPEGGGYRKHTIVHTDKVRTLEDKIVNKKKLSLSDLRKLIDLENEI